MPVMFRTNICLEIGLINGTIGRVYSVLGKCLPALETDAAVISRVSSDSGNSLYVPCVLVNLDKFYTGKIGALEKTSQIFF